VFVDSQKPNSLVILRRAQELLRERGVDVAEEIIQKRSAGIPMEDQVLDRLALEGGLVLSGVND
jgi:predicted O-methyltransferase YrrM